MGLLDGLFGGAATGDPGLPQDEWKRAALEDLLARLSNGGEAPKGVAPNYPAPSQAGIAAPARPGPWETSTIVGATPVAERRAVGQAYTAPEAAIVPDDVRRRESAMSAPATPAVRPAPSPAAAPFTPSGSQKMQDFFTALSGGGIRDRATENDQKNATFNYMIAKGIPEAEARNVIMSGNAALMNSVLAGKTAPPIVKVPGPYGTEIDTYWDGASGRLRPLTDIMAPGAAASTPKMGDVVLPGQTPAASPSMAQPAAPIAATVAAPVATPAIPATPLGTGARQTPAEQAAGDFAIGTAVPKPPEGYVHRLSPDGKGYLYSRDGKPVFDVKATVEKSAEGRAKSNEEDRNKALAAIETARKVQDVYGKLDTPFGFEKPYETKAGMKFDTWGDVVGPYSVPTAPPASSGPVGSAVNAITNAPTYLLQAARNIKGLYDPQVEKINSARNELETALASLQGSRVKELFGSQNLSDADREAAAKTVGTLTAQNATALKGQLSVGEKDSFTRIAKALDDGLIAPNDVPQDIMSRGIKLGLLKPDLVFKRSK